MTNRYQRPPRQINNRALIVALLMCIIFLMIVFIFAFYSLSPAIIMLLSAVAILFLICWWICGWYILTERKQ